ncbi:MAG: prenyltransferase/squalene oxidase repeat-containing protein [Bacteroidota bacterium]
MTRTDLEYRFTFLSGKLTSELNAAGFWTGRLSSSALATAVSVVALRLGDPDQSRERITRGIAWLAATINEDGGFGDTPGSLSNLSATLLCYAAIRFCANDCNDICDSRPLPQQLLPNISDKEDQVLILHRIEQYLNSEGVDLKSTGVVTSILGYYGNDYTFSAPILSMLMICRVLDSATLDHIPTLPFELALLPFSLYRFFNLQVVSYAIPALVAVGIYQLKHKRRRNPATAFIRARAIEPALRKLLAMMPESGGFLEAIPLTAFVAMCLIQSGFGNRQVVLQGIGFLKNVQRSDGSWSIDTDLSTWVTTLSVKAFGNHIHEKLTILQKDRLRLYLTDNQYQISHLFNNARPGGWGWTSFSGSVPDADDTAGAILALILLEQGGKTLKTEILRGCSWLAGIQNSDGGIPTFCKGWGRLPFDRSCADLTSHAILAWTKTIDRYCSEMQEIEIAKLKGYATRALRFLEKEQYADGSWLPLWFGNQLTGDKKNPVYGTARAMVYLQDALSCNIIDDVMKKLMVSMVNSANLYLSHQQNDDGSWGAKKGIEGSIEETSLSICALAATESVRCEKGFAWLDREYRENGLPSKPIGLYFATLWYDEKLYPIVFYLEALRRALQQIVPL